MRLLLSLACLLSMMADDLPTTLSKDDKAAIVHLIDALATATNAGDTTTLRALFARDAEATYPPATTPACGDDLLKTLPEPDRGRPWSERGPTRYHVNTIEELTVDTAALRIESSRWSSVMLYSRRWKAVVRRKSGGWEILVWRPDPARPARPSASEH